MFAASLSFDRDRVMAIAAAITCAAVVGIGLSLSIPLLSLEMERMGGSSTLIGLNTAVGGFASIITVPFVPRLAARVGVMRLLLASIGLGAAVLVGFRVFYDLAWWFPLRFVFSVMLGGLFVLSEFWITQAAPSRHRGLVMGIYATVLAIGFTVGPALLVLLGTEGYAPYLAGAALFLVGGVPIVLARGVAPQISQHGGGPTFIAYLRLAPAATFAALLYGAVETGGFAILPLYGLKLGFDAQTAAGLVSMVALGNVVFQIPVGWLADRIDRSLVFLATGTLGALGALLMPAASTSLTTLSILLFVWGGIAGTLYTVGLAHLGASVRGRDLAGANAAFIALYGVGLMLGPPMIGSGMDLVMPQGFAWTLALMFAAYAAIVAVTILRRTDMTDRHSPPEQAEQILR